MNLSDFSKEQKQYLMLGSVVALVLFSGIVFSVRFRQTSVSKAQRELDDISCKISQADRELSRRSKIKTDFEKTVISLKGYLKNIPPSENYYSWATDIIYSTTRAAGLEVDAIEEIKNSVSKKDKKSVCLETYSLRITGRGGFKNVKQFLQHFEEEQPLVRLSGLEISARSEPNIHDVQFFIQWPVGVGEIASFGDYVNKMPVIEDLPIAPILESLGKQLKSSPQLDKVVRAPDVSDNVVVSGLKTVDVLTEPYIPESIIEPQVILEGSEEDGSLSAGAVDAYIQKSGDVVVSLLDSSPDLEEKPKTATAELAPVVNPRDFLPSEMGRSDNGDRKLVALLQKQEPDEDETLVSFLDGLVEEINE